MPRTGPTRTLDHLGKALHPSIGDLKRDVSHVNGFNAKLAVLITRLVGTMWCAYLFGIIALIGLGPPLRPGGEGIVAWVAQTFLQLVLLSIIMVGQSVQSIASDARSEHTFEDTERIIDALDIRTEGGLKAVLDAIEQLKRAG